jgi:hypothetical protein
MKSALTTGNKDVSKSARDMFRIRFQRSMRECLRHGFAVEESFGLVWEETLDEFCLLDAEQSTVYEELIAWARGLPSQICSPLFTAVIDTKSRKSHANP